MKRIIFIFFSLLLVAAGCKKSDKIPRGVLPPAKMENVLLDMMRADEFLTGYVFSRDSALNKKAESIKAYQKIFRIHRVDKGEFEKSFSYYRSHPLLLKVMMDSLTNRLTRIAEEENKPKPIMTTDSFIKNYKSPVK
jgi:hypothetical protein